MPLKYPSLSEEDTLTSIGEGMLEGRDQSACIWNVVRSEKGAYIDSPETRNEWNMRYLEITGFLKKKGLYKPEISPLVDGFKRDIRRLLGSV